MDDNINSLRALLGQFRRIDSDMNGSTSRQVSKDEANRLKTIRETKQKQAGAFSFIKSLGSKNE